MIKTEAWLIKKIKNNDNSQDSRHLMMINDYARKQNTVKKVNCRTEIKTKIKPADNLI